MFKEKQYEISGGIWANAMWEFLLSFPSVSEKVSRMGDVLGAPTFFHGNNSFENAAFSFHLEAGVIRNSRHEGTDSEQGKGGASANIEK